MQREDEQLALACKQLVPAQSALSLPSVPSLIIPCQCSHHHHCHRHPVSSLGAYRVVAYLHLASFPCSPVPVRTSFGVGTLSTNSSSSLTESSYHRGINAAAAFSGDVSGLRPLFNRSPHGSVGNASLFRRRLSCRRKTLCSPHKLATMITWKLLPLPPLLLLPLQHFIIEALNLPVGVAHFV